ncbi:hypothetical protein QTP88_026377 [Uroleucon formosanum]
MAVNFNNINNANLVIINWNANGLKQNRNTLAAFLNSHNVDIACISETHLINADKIKFNGYVTYRKDRLVVRPSGGVSIIIKSKIKHHHTFIPVLQSLEAELLYLSTITSLISAYQSPNFKMFTSDFDKILCSFQKVMIIGDLNSKHTTWNCKMTNQNGRKLHKYLSNTSTNNSSPDSPAYYPYDKNRNPNILDVILLKLIPLSIHQEPLFELDSDHLPVKITIGGALSVSTKSLSAALSMSGAGRDDDGGGMVIDAGEAGLEGVRLCTGGDTTPVMGAKRKGVPSSPPLFAEGDEGRIEAGLAYIRSMLKSAMTEARAVGARSGSDGLIKSLENVFDIVSQMLTRKGKLRTPLHPS